MNTFYSALWTEMFKARRSRVPLSATIGFLLAPLTSGLFMMIMKDPERAREMGLLSTKAQLMMTTAEWSTFFGMLAQAVAIGGFIVFSIVAIWIFGREFTDRTAKDLMALPTSREEIISAKFIVVAVWVMVTTMLIFGVGLLVAAWVNLPGWTNQLGWNSFRDVMLTAGLNLLLMTPVTFFASAGRGYLPPFGWTILAIFFAQVIAATGWGDWFPWAVPALFSGMIGPRSEQLGLHSYILVFLASIFGLIATYYWWRNTDQTR